MDNWVFFGANIIFTAFNAWLAWQAWRRQVASDLPTANLAVSRSPDQPVWEVEVVITNRTSTTWTCKSATLLRPRRKALYYPPLLMMQNEFGEPWNPRPVDLAKAVATDAVVLLARAQPGGYCREVLWIDQDVSGTLQIDLELESSEPQPRRHAIHVKRQIPAFRAVKAT